GRAALLHGRSRRYVDTNHGRLDEGRYLSSAPARPRDREAPRRVHRPIRDIEADLLVHHDLTAVGERRDTGRRTDSTVPPGHGPCASPPRTIRSPSDAHNPHPGRDDDRGRPSRDRVLVAREPVPAPGQSAVDAIDVTAIAVRDAASGFTERCVTNRRGADRLSASVWPRVGQAPGSGPRRRGRGSSAAGAGSGRNALRGHSTIRRVGPGARGPGRATAPGVADPRRERRTL